MNQPRPESRISALEALTSTHTAHIRELASDTAEDFRGLKQDIKQLSDSIEASYKQIGDTFIAFANTMATKEDISRLETRFDKLETTQSEHSALLRDQGEKLDQILMLLQSLKGSQG